MTADLKATVPETAGLKEMVATTVGSREMAAATVGLREMGPYSHKWHKKTEHVPFPKLGPSDLRRSIPRTCSSYQHQDEAWRPKNKGLGRKRKQIRTWTGAILHFAHSMAKRLD